MGDNTGSATAVNNNPAAAPVPVQYVLMSSLFFYLSQILLEFLVLAIGIDLLSPKSLLCMPSAYSLEIHMTSLILAIIVMLYLLFFIY